jgi:hypothetical protein
MVQNPDSVGCAEPDPNPDSDPGRQKLLPVPVRERKEEVEILRFKVIDVFFWSAEA